MVTYLTSHLLFLLLVHFSQSDEVFDEEHKVDPAQRRQTLPHAVQVFVLLGVVMTMGSTGPRILLVVVTPLGLEQTGKRLLVSSRRQTNTYFELITLNKYCSTE